MKSFPQMMKVLALAALLSCACSPTPSEQPSGNDGLKSPANLSVVSMDPHSATLRWDAVDGAASYNWKLLEGSRETSRGSETATSVSVSGLKASTAYAFSVCAVNADVKSDFCNLSFTTPSEESPAPDIADGQCIDAPLRLDFSSAPVLGNSGMIRVFTENGSEVDRIDLADLASVTIREDGCMIPLQQITDASSFSTFMDAIHSGSRYRIEHYTPLRIKGNTLEIKLHNDVLEFGKTYYVTVDESVAGKAVASGEWTFTVKSAPTASTLRVSQDGSADFCTVQGALTYASSLGKAAEVTVEIAAGTYHEMLFLRDKNNVTIKGASRSSTVISYPNNESYCAGSGGSATSRPAKGSAVGKSGGRGLALVESCDNLRIENLTIENTFNQEKGQAETIYFNSSGSLAIEDCNLLSWQDTFLTKGRVWVHNSLIAGHVDFIWGYPEVCLFEDCEIRSRAAGYIIQARVQPAGAKGFVFLNCKLTADETVKNGSVYLGRSAGQADCYDHVVYVNCSMSPAIAASGWYTNPSPNPSAATATAGWREFGSTDGSGNALSVGARASCSRQLSASEAEAYASRAAVLGW